NAATLVVAGRGKQHAVVRDERTKSANGVFRIGVPRNIAKESPGILRKRREVHSVCGAENTRSRIALRVIRRNIRKQFSRRNAAEIERLSAIGFGEYSHAAKPDVTSRIYRLT